MSGSGAERKCRHGSLPAATGGIPENIYSSRAFLDVLQFPAVYLNVAEGWEAAIRSSRLNDASAP
jgi:hypothetical protein